MKCEAAALAEEFGLFGQLEGLLRRRNGPL